MTLLSITFALFLIIDPFGNINPYLKLMRHVEPKKQTAVLLREMSIALFTMLVFNFIGEGIFGVLGISEETVRISSGVILFLIAMQILFPTLNSLRNQLPDEEPFIVPFAIPLVAGPSLLATVMLYARMVPEIPLMVGAILFAWFLALLIFFNARKIHQILGDNGLLACEKLMGIVLILLAIQRFLDGVYQFLHHT